MKMSSDEEVFLLYAYIRQKRKGKRTIWTHDILKRRQIFGEYHHLVKELYSYEDKFFEYFRMSTSQFEYIRRMIEGDIKKSDTNYREALSPRERLAICLRFLATGDSYRTISFSYRVGKSTVSAIVAETCEAIWRRLQPLYLQKPIEEDWINIAEGFEKRWQFPNCIGAIDGKHVIITAPQNSGSLYFNYKKTFSVVLLALVDHKYCFSVIDVGSYGSNSDGGIFKRSSLGRKLKNESLDIPGNKTLPGAPDIGPMPHILVGDEAFPLTIHSMRPIPGRQLGTDERIYNYRLSRARRISENVFGILANRWRMYHRKIPLDPKNVDIVVRATCVLHNLLQSYDMAAPLPKFPLEQEYDQTEGILRDMTRQGCHASSDAVTVRNNFKEYFSSAAGSVSWQNQCCFGNAN